ncbi:MAG: hypothetical protein FIA95_01235 [Gemmatimonadetes bacterium]|nr:hypothetical protein [Gemmatimonadota bacterium]
MQTSALATEVFKVCGSCRRTWHTWEEFVTDPEVRLLGLQSRASVPEATVLVFEHFCGGSVSILTHRLHHLVPGHPAAGWPSLRDTDRCPAHSLDISDHRRCVERCRHVLDREIVAIATALQATRKYGRRTFPEPPPPAL